MPGSEVSQTLDSVGPQFPDLENKHSPCTCLVGLVTALTR